jgi:hypothetical protein
MKRPNKITLITAAVLAFLFLFVLDTRLALAHTRIEVGPYVIVIGWENEPVVVGERNALLFEVSQDDEPVEGLEGTLEIAVLYGGQTFTGNLQPGPAPGTYTVEILPTVRGQYSVQLTGMIEDLEIDEIVEPEEVLPATVLQFPESPPDARELQASIDELASQLQTVMILAIAGLGLAVAGIGLAAVSLLKSRR